MECVVLRFLLASAVILTAATVISGERVNRTSATAGLVWSKGKLKSDLLSKPEQGNSDDSSAGADDDLDGGFSSLDGMLQWAIDRQRALQELLILVEPLDNANDLNKLGGLAVVIQELNHPDPDTRRLLHGFLEKLILELGALTKLIKMVKSTSIEEAIKALYAVSALIQNNFSGQELFYAEAGDAMLQEILSNSNSDIRLCRKAVFLVADLVECQSENIAIAESLVFRNCFFLKPVVDLTASTDLDLQEKALVAIKNLLQLTTTDALIFKDFCDLNGSLERMRQQLLDLMASEDHRDYAVDLETLRREVELLFP
ncbi:hypothetical protein OIU84_003799 [Salix udensis]|uniref:Nucleotide exchange factor Fes1 domain-containing protein n=1 Tax=Salix udensis TaxID=889485 RepID=A0AAD6P388_9ROSI|nr:hypothetical protein OIU84_003799 [Salix udensis]